MKKQNIFGVLAILFLVILVAGCGGKKPDFKALEEDLINEAKAYYNNNIKDKVFGINNHLATLENLKATGVDIQKYLDASCDEESYVLIKTTLDDEGKPVGDPTYEVSLSCAGYTKSE